MKIWKFFPTTMEYTGFRKDSTNILERDETLTSPCVILTLMIFVCCYYFCSLLWCNYWRSVILWNSTFWSRLTWAVQIQLAHHPFDPFLINNLIMTSNSVEKRSVMLNVKLQVKLRLKTFSGLLKLLYTAFSLSTTANTVCFTRNFCIS